MGEVESHAGADLGSMLNFNKTDRKKIKMGNKILLYFQLSKLKNLHLIFHQPHFFVEFEL